MYDGEGCELKLTWAKKIKTKIFTFGKFYFCVCFSGSNEEILHQNTNFKSTISFKHDKSKIFTLFFLHFSCDMTVN